ncbi:OmpA family protein [Porticoccaceae bacterium]|nr:OmpA family protein [Porticoccaceae bacterium]
MAEQDDEKALDLAANPENPENSSDAEEAPLPVPVAEDEEQLEDAEPPEEQEPAPDPDCPPCKGGAPAWMATFADMATLLMAFFVLLLSFAEMNVPKYKEVSGSMKNAFGVQRLVPVVEPPKAKSIIAKQYKAAKVDPTLMDVIQEQTTDEEPPIDPELKTDTKTAESPNNSDVESVQKALAKEIAEGKVSVRIEDNKLVVKVASEAKSGESGDASKNNSGARISQNDLEVYAKVAAAQAQVASQIMVEQASPDKVAQDMSGESAEGKEQAIADQFQRIRMQLSEEISEGLAEVERDGDKIIVRLAERGSFRSGYADLQQGFKPLLNKVGASISNAVGLITIEGHTDNVPMAFSERFRSNWDLSAARSAAVADYLLNNSNLEDGRVTVTGFADTKPLASNDTAAGRSKNRRIEVIIDGQ